VRTGQAARWCRLWIAVVTGMVASGVATQPAAASIPSIPRLTVVAYTGTGTYEVTWVDQSFNETGFKVYHSLGRKLPFTVARQLSSSSTGSTGQTYTRTFTDMSSGRLHCFRVVAVNDDGDSNPSSTLCNASSAPSAPTVTVTHEAETNHVDVVWTRSDREDQYDVYYRASGSSTWIKEGPTRDASGSETYEKTAPAPDGTTYCYRVDASNLKGSVSSNEACLTLGPRPLAPATINATATPTSITLSWTDRTTVETRYELWGGEGRNVIPTTLVRTWGPLTGTTTFTITDLSPLTYYTFWLYAFNSAGNGKAGKLVQTPGTVTLERQTGSGPVPYRGQFPAFGVVPTGHLVQIRVPQVGPADLQVRFVKAGHTTAECNNPSAVVVVGEGQSTTPAQITEIFGQAEPPFSTLNPLVFTACLGTTGSLPNWVNIHIFVEFD
jgi:Fibronectin type III domain